MNEDETVDEINIYAGFSELAKQICEASDLIALARQEVE